MLIATADIHLSDNLRDEYRLAFMENRLPQIVKSHKAGGVIILGDITEEKDRHSAWLVNRVVDAMKGLAAVCPVLVIMGNHDYTSPSDPFFRFLGDIPGITWVSQPTHSYHMESKFWRKTLPPSILLPHSRDPEKDWAKLDLQDVEFIFAHNTFEGATGGFGRELHGVPLSLLPKGVPIIAGDVHVPQTKGVLTYIGAPYHVDFGDDYQPRLLKFEKHGWHDLPLRGFPQKQLVEIRRLSDLNKQDHLSVGDILKVRAYPKDYADWPKWRKEIHQWAQEGGYALYQLVCAARSPAKSSNTDNDRAAIRDDDEVLRDYAQRMGIDANTLKMGLKIKGRS